MKSNPQKLSVADGSLIIETMTKSTDELLNDGYIKLDNKSLAQFSPVIRLIEEVGMQKWAGKTAAKTLKSF